MLSSIQNTNGNILFMAMKTQEDIERHTMT